MIVVTGNQMKAIDNYCIERLGIPGIVLMENAALKVIKNIDLDKFKSFTIVCGVGNNGGDGLAVGRHLIVEGKTVNIFVIGRLNKGSRDFNINYNILKNMKVRIKQIEKEDDLEELINSIKNSDMTIDAIFGTGLTRDVGGLYRHVISIINEHSKYILSVDIPSGIDSDTGKELGISVKANKVVSFQLMKKGLVDFDNVVLEPIGMPRMAIEEVLKRSIV
ncbi:MAG: NAD(P)H-hydrate epimerase [Tissierellia bacterium]|nr:NAD(P)H-hydrate epimerase [Tissierellia bacterium]